MTSVIPAGAFSLDTAKLRIDDLKLTNVTPEQILSELNKTVGKAPSLGDANNLRETISGTIDILREIGAEGALEMAKVIFKDNDIISQVRDVGIGRLFNAIEKVETLFDKDDGVSEPVKKTHWNQTSEPSVPPNEIPTSQIIGHIGHIPIHARQAAYGVMDELLERKGVGDALQQVDPETYADIMAAVSGKIAQVYNPSIASGLNVVPAIEHSTLVMSPETYFHCNLPVSFNPGESEDGQEVIQPSLEIVAYRPRKDVISQVPLTEEMPTGQTPKQFFLTAAQQHIGIAQEFHRLANGHDRYECLNPGNYLPEVEVVTAENEERVNTRLSNWFKQLNEE